MPHTATPQSVQTIDNPIRLRRLRSHLSQVALARAAEMTREALAALEFGTSRPSEQTLTSLSKALETAPDELGKELEEWMAEFEDRKILVTDAQADILSLNPQEVLAKFPSWQAWRNVFAGSVRQFSLMLGVNRSGLARFEAGLAPLGLPVPVQEALIRRFEVSGQYVQALSLLPIAPDSIARKSS